MKLLIIQQKMIGDVLTSTTLAEGVKERYPESEVHYLINHSTAPVVKNNPHIDKLILLSPEEQKSKLKFWKFIKTVNNEKYDVVIDVYSKLSSNLITLFSKAEKKISFYKIHTALIYDHNIERKNNIDIISNRLRLLEPLDIKKNNYRPKIYLTPSEIDKAKNLLLKNNLNLNKPLFMISILGSTDSKTYPIAYMAQIIDTIVEETKGQILFNYIPNQMTEAKNLYHLCKEKTKFSIFFDLYAKNLREFLALTHHCNALLGNEGGAINMAKALNIPTFAIFSPWINQKGWALFQDGKKMDSIHLSDVKPKIFEGKNAKQIKNSYKDFYKAFKPELIIPKIKSYLKNL